MKKVQLGEIRGGYHQEFGGVEFLKEITHLCEQSKPMVSLVLNFIFLTNGQDAWVFADNRAGTELPSASEEADDLFRGFQVKGDGRIIPPDDFFVERSGGDFGLCHTHIIDAVTLDPEGQIKFMLHPGVPVITDKEKTDFLKLGDDAADVFVLKKLQEQAVIFYLPDHHVARKALNMYGLMTDRI